MNKVDLIQAIQQKLGVSKKAAEEAADAVFDAITSELSKGGEVTVSGFGTFFVKERHARAGINPRTGEKIQIAATRTPKFHAGKALKAAVK